MDEQRELDIGQVLIYNEIKWMLKIQFLVQNGLSYTSGYDSNIKKRVFDLWS
jgi:hypothetical protein